MDIKHLLSGGAADLGKLIKGLSGGDLDWTQIPSFARMAGFPEDECSCLAASTEAFSRDIKNPMRDTRNMLIDLVDNFDQVGPEHLYYIAFRLIDNAHNHFAGPIKENRKEEAIETDQPRNGSGNNT